MNTKYKITYPSGRTETISPKNEKRETEMKKKLRALYGDDVKIERIG